MLNINNVLITGGHYLGNNSWDKEASSLDQCFKVYQIIEGEAYLYSSNEKYKLEAGGIYFINGFQIQKQSCPNSFEVNWLHFISDSIFIKQIFLKLPVITRLSSGELCNFLKVFDSFDEFFKNYSTDQKSLEARYLSDYFKIQSLLSWITGEIFYNMDAENDGFHDFDNRLFEAVKYINSHYKSNISLKTLSDLCYLSENYFHNLFKKEFGITPNTYILQLRMNEAVNLLVNSRLSVKEIAQETGFFDAAYFSRTFSKYFDMSPKEYRNSYKKRIP